MITEFGIARALAESEHGRTMRGLVGTREAKHESRGSASKRPRELDKAYVRETPITMALGSLTTMDHVPSRSSPSTTFPKNAIRPCGM